VCRCRAVAVDSVVGQQQRERFSVRFAGQIRALIGDFEGTAVVKLRYLLISFSKTGFCGYFQIDRGSNTIYATI
jgi:hypothetical protein